MKRFTMFVCLAITLVFAMNAFATGLPQRAIGHDSVFHGGSTEVSKSGRDTIFVVGPWGSGAGANGQFEDINGNPDWNGWTHWDITQPTVNHFHLSDYNSPNGAGNQALYCGDETIPACSITDVDGGYESSWNDIMRFSYVVADANASCTITVSGIISHDSEPGFDYTYFKFITANGPVEAGSVDGIGTGVMFTYSHTYGTSDYVGDNADEVRFDINFKSDGSYDDGDCNYPSAGACSVDDIHTVCTNGGYDVTEDFSVDYGDWECAYPLGTGDFSQIWQGLEEIDPCYTNYSPQVAFIDDGTQVPGVGPSYCQDWCYGPGGYIVNTTGGAAIVDDPAAYMYNAIESPVVEWPAGGGYIGSQLTFGIFRHEDLSPDSPGMFYTWSVRSGTSEAAALSASWADRNFVYYGGPDYVRAGDVVSDLLAPGLTHAQVQLTCYELGWNWGFIGDDGYPAPYFDNVRLTAYTAEGPGMSTRELDIANDNWPTIGQIDMGNLAANSVRFDAAQNNGSDELNVPGDSIVCDVASVRVGGSLTVNRLVYTMQRNPVFNSVRDGGWGASGSVDAVPAEANGNIIPGTFAYDLPDEGFLFPGDVLHYYFEATDEVGHANPQTSTLPANLDGYGDFDNPTAYNTGFQVHALPTVDAEGNHPSILFWNDFANRGGENEWYGALNNLGLVMGEHYDAYYTNAPSSGVGNGLGGRASNLLLEGYETMLYTCGDLGVNTISNGDPAFDPSDDIGLVSDWLDFGAVNLFATGDELVSDMNGSGVDTGNLLNNYINVTPISDDVRPLIENQTTPLVIVETGASVFSAGLTWIAYGGCNGINTFDAVEVRPGAEQLARFADPGGVADYSYSAATLNQTAGGDNIITMPYDFMNIYTDIDNPVAGGIATRVQVLDDVLTFFGFDTGVLVPSDVPDAEKFVASNYPNPFNPSTKIQFNMPKAGHLSMKIYNVRGELVKTLIDESRAAGAGHIMWDGTNDQGSSVSSGVYFYEARTAGEVSINKMALVK